MNVLSLFDGMSCGQLALNKAGIKYDKYYASEIDKNAIKVAQHNFPKTNHLGDVTKWRDWGLPNIDLLIGGSPCQGFSTVGKGLNFEDPRSKLFFEFVDILKHVNPKYFLLENVRMKQESQDIITEFLGVPPIKINSSLVSAQNRERLYWTNIPSISSPHDRGVTLSQILEEVPPKEFFLKNRKGSTKFVEKKYDEFFKKHGYIPERFNPYNCKELGEKSPTLTAEGSRISVSSTVLIKEDCGDIRSLSPLEWERLQTVPDNYTEILSNTHRYNVLGNGWTVDVIAHILSGIKEGSE